MSWILDRLKEPSTHAGLATLFLAASQFFPQYASLILGVAGLFGCGAVATTEKTASKE